MKQFLKRFFPIILALWPYLFFLLAYLFADADASWLIAYMLFTVAVYICNIIYAWQYKDEKEISHLAFWNMLIKLIHIPFYLFIFCLGILSVLIAVVPAFIFLTPFLVILLFLIDVCLMITSSMYGISALSRAAKQNKLSKAFLIVNMILHLFFLADIISSIIVFVKLRNKRKA